MWRWAAVLGMAAVLIGCGGDDGTGGGGPGRGTNGGGPRVVASIFPLGSLAEQVVGEAGEVSVLLPAGRSPHAFELTVQQVRTLAEADMLVVAGGGVDPWALDAAERFGEQVRVVNVHEVVREPTEETHENANEAGGAQGEGEHAHAHAGRAVNPHHWLDPKRTADFVSHLGTELAREFPAHGEALLANTQQAVEMILEVDADYRERLRSVKRRELVTFHNAFDPLARRYDLDVVAHLTPIELTPGGEVTPGRLQAVMDAIDRHDLAVIYAEPQFPEAAVAALRQRTGVAVLRLDPLGSPRRPGYDSWQAMMRSNLETLVDGQNR